MKVTQNKWGTDFEGVENEALAYRLVDSLERKFWGSAYDVGTNRPRIDRGKNELGDTVYTVTSYLDLDDNEVMAIVADADYLQERLVK